ncbi:non-canonical purine NTP diphosphatase [Zunongwangia sp. F363]|uniref:dITP/XTP pyrophosphatase n=1 Tax=Autumnicola tepida TaxID=3075595 RepID=A0ABU3CEK9_9FLAO|nr:non-canonical purine NTP diphosphatase [Zunongwangia sp. F363]MDT0644741.1 non-canonical purine NTP diphosphatase [Zunongwangia sp. F363]
MELVFATHNKNKMAEIKALLPKNIKLLSLDDIGCTEDIPETADTIDGNAILKAEYVRRRYGYDCFADDTGLEVEALAGAPGVFSARFAGDEKNDEANVQKLLKHLEGKSDRRAQFKTVIALNLKDNENLFTGICKGEILEERRGAKGFGYDPVFRPEGKEQSFAEMDMGEKAAVSHRGKAFRELIAYLSQ